MAQTASALLSAALLMALAGTTITQMSRSKPVPALPPSPAAAPGSDAAEAARSAAAPAVEEVTLPPPPALDPPQLVAMEPLLVAVAQPKATVAPLRPAQPAETPPLLVVPLLPAAEPAPPVGEAAPPPVAERPPLRPAKLLEEPPRRPLVPLEPATRLAPPTSAAPTTPIESVIRRVEKRVVPFEAPPVPSSPVSVETVGREIVVKGRVLLRLLEHGKGPAVEIAWPAVAVERERLFGLLRDCFDLRMALVDAQGRLFLADGERGRPSDLNIDRYSGFVRQIDRSMSGGADAEERRIRDRHGGLPSAQPAFLLPRVADALLLGGLRHLVGSGYEREGAIRARYVLAGGRLLVEDIVAGGRVVPGVIDLTGAGRRPCARL